MKKISTLALMFAAALVLSACGDSHQYPQTYAQPAQYAQPAPVQYQQAPQPVVIQQAAPQGSGFHTGDAAIGALAGAAAMHAFSNRPAAVAPAVPSYQPRYYQPSRAVTTTTVRKTATGSVTRTVTRRR